jgi:hypothetical protein
MMSTMDVTAVVSPAGNFWLVAHQAGPLQSDG